MTKRLTLSAFLSLFLLAAAPQAQAQQDFSLGPRASYDVGGDLESFAIGADLRFGVESLPVRINPAFDYYFLDEDTFGDGVSIFQITANALYELGIENTTFTPYAGGGLSYLRASIDGGDSDSDVGFNILGGAEFTEVNGFVPFAQAEFVLGGDLDIFKITGGILFDL